MWSLTVDACVYMIWYAWFSLSHVEHRIVIDSVYLGVRTFNNSDTDVAEEKVTLPIFVTWYLQYSQEVLVFHSVTSDEYSIILIFKEGNLTISYRQKLSSHWFKLPKWDSAHVYGLFSHFGHVIENISMLLKFKDRYNISLSLEDPVTRGDIERRENKGGGKRRKEGN